MYTYNSSKLFASYLLEDMNGGVCNICHFYLAHSGSMSPSVIFLFFSQEKNQLLVYLFQDSIKDRTIQGLFSSRLAVSRKMQCLDTADVALGPPLC